MKLTTWNPNATLSPRQGVRATTLAEANRRERLYDRIEVRLAAHEAAALLRVVGVHDLTCGNLCRLVPLEDQPQ